MCIVCFFVMFWKEVENPWEQPSILTAAWEMCRNMAGPVVSAWEKEGLGIINQYIPGSSCLGVQ